MDSIITTIITSTIVRIITGSKVGMPNAKGVTMSNQCAVATLAKLILPSSAASAQPATMPSSTEMLATKPRAYFTSSRMKTSTTAAMAMLSSAP